MTGDVKSTYDETSLREYEDWLCCPRRSLQSSSRFSVESASVGMRVYRTSTVISLFVLILPDKNCNEKIDDDLVDELLLCD